MSNEKIVLLIDGLNTFFRSYAVDPSISTRGDHIGGLKGFLKQLQKFCREMRPSEICVVWDGEGGSKKRKEIKKDYKAGRKSVNPKNYNRFVDTDISEEEIKENKVWQMMRLIEFLNEMPVRQFLVDNVEADDIIAVLANRYYDGWKKVIISNDKDFLQLANEETVIYRPAVKKIMNRDDVIEKHKIHPTNMALSRAILGDASDNLPGVSGIGPKTLQKLFPSLSGSATVTLDMLLEEVQSVDEKKRKKVHDTFEENIDVVKLNYKMMQLYNPKMGNETIKKVEGSLEDMPNYSQFEIEKMMIEDGFAEYNWQTMFAHFAGMMHDYKKQ